MGRVPTTVDFETEAIAPRPDYPPKPVGVALWEPGRKPVYLAWGHSTGNNTTFETARHRLRAIWSASDRPLLFHHERFDLDVAETHLGLPMPPIERCHCTMLLAFLADPNGRNFQLKTLAQKYCGMEPEERDLLKSWIIANVKEAKRRRSTWGAYIARAPGNLVDPYAIGDVVRTRKLYDVLMPGIQKLGMQKAYQLEKKLERILMRDEKLGIPIREAALRKRIPKWEHSLQQVDAYLQKRFHSPDLNPDSADDLADALEEAGHVEEWIATRPSKTYPTGKRSTKIEHLRKVCTDLVLVDLLAYRSRLAHTLSNCARPWRDMLDRGSKGHIYCTWSSVRQAQFGGARQIGARTGRLSTSPNMQNLPKVPAQVVYDKASWKAAKAQDRDVLLLPRALAGDLVSLPNVRDYVIPETGGTLLGRDVNQQELRILAHYVGGVLLDMYKKDPNMDIHTRVQKMLASAYSYQAPRSRIKTLLFGLVYRMGLDLLSDKTNIKRGEARTLRMRIKRMLEIGQFEQALELYVREGGLMRTYAGRIYAVEPDITFTDWSNGTRITKSLAYKSVNTAVQGSAADHLKQAWVNFDSLVNPSEARILLTVHDEVAITTYEGVNVRSVMKRAKEALEDVHFKLKMTTTGKSGRTWGSMRPWRD